MRTRELAMSARKRISRHTVPIFHGLHSAEGDRAERLTSAGTCVAFDLKTCKALVTAKHVIDDLIESTAKEPRLFYGFPQAIVRDRSTFPFVPLWEAAGRVFFDDLDVEVIPVSEEVILSFFPDVRWIDMGDTVFQEAPLNGAVVVQGYPTNRFDENFLGELAESQYSLVTGLSKRNIEGEIEDYSPTTSFYFEHAPKANFYDGARWEEREHGPLGGLSGAGVWVEWRDSDDALPKLRLAGIQTGVFDKTGLVRATNWWSVYERLIARFPPKGQR